jgi:hypothetical protein
MAEALAGSHDLSANGVWTPGMLRDYFLTLIDANDQRYGREWVAIRELIEAADKRYEQRFKAEESASIAMLAAQERAILAAVANVKEDAQKTASAIEKRLENTNEWRESFSDRDRLLMPRKEAELAISAVSAQISQMMESLREQRVAAALTSTARDSKATGIHDGWGYAAGIIGLVLTVMSIFSFFVNRMAIPK